MPARNWRKLGKLGGRAMPKSVMFETLEASPVGNCSVCGANPATLKAAGAHEGDCCLPCASNILATLAQWTVVNRFKQSG
jgi:hypothetical protein